MFLSKRKIWQHILVCCCLLNEKLQIIKAILDKNKLTRTQNVCQKQTGLTARERREYDVCKQKLYLATDHLRTLKEFLQKFYNVKRVLYSLHARGFRCHTPFRLDMAACCIHLAFKVHAFTNRPMVTEEQKKMRRCGYIANEATIY